MPFSIDILTREQEPMIDDWFNHHGRSKVLPDLEDCKKCLLSVDGKPALFAAIIWTSARIAWLEAFVGNPEIPKEERRKYTPEFMQWAEVVAKENGCKKMMALSPNEKLTEYYGLLGLNKTISVAVLIKEIL